MKITVTGTIEEIKRAKNVIDSCCFFSSEFCSDIGCNKCTEYIKKHSLEVEYIEENKQEV